MKESNINSQIQKIDDRLAQLPDGYLTTKTIRGKQQPYFQWHEDGKTKSRYIREEERLKLHIEMEEKDTLQRERKRLLEYRRKLQDSWKNYSGIHRQSRMTLPVSIGIQSFSEIMEKHLFYVDKSLLISEWWQDQSKVNLITRPRRFGKSLNLDMLDCFFSTHYANRADLFESLQIWQNKKLRTQQGVWPVIHMDFSGMKSDNYDGMLYQMTHQIQNQYYKHGLLSLSEWSLQEKWNPERMQEELKRLCASLSEKTNGKKILVLIDEYDTPIQEAWGSGYYEKAVKLMRLIFQTLLKSNEYLEKALLTGITRISRESLFSDSNNMVTSSVTDDSYSTFFGFKEKEVFAAMDSQDLHEHVKVKEWYDGFTFGEEADIYNPWSVTNYLKSGKLDTYWANTSSNKMIGDLLKKSSPNVKKQFELLMEGKGIEAVICKNLIWADLEKDERFLWGLFLSAGYLTGKSIDKEKGLYELWITNHETELMFEQLFLRWFSGNTYEDYNDFVCAMLKGKAEMMNDCLTEILFETCSYFDVGGTTPNRKTENFYHGFILGLISSLRKEYQITSNRESGWGIYDLVLEQKEKENAVILEFKVCREDNLEESAAKALRQIEEKGYDAQLLQNGIPKEKIWKYGIAFRGKEALVTGNASPSTFHKIPQSSGCCSGPIL